MEDDGAVAAPLTLWAAMAEEKVEEMMTREELCVDRIDRLSAQSATLKSSREVLTHLDSQSGPEHEQHANLFIFPKRTIPVPGCCVNTSS